MFCRMALMFILAVPCSLVAQERDPLFARSYAVVIGINGYTHSKWPKLNYALKDAQGFSAFLREQGFEVIELYEDEATKSAILSSIEDKLVPRLTADDRVVVFFAGHGETRAVGSVDRGYLVPVDGTDSYASLIPVTQLHDLSELMGVARHQLFVLDSCFGGLAAMRAGGGEAVDPRAPNYVYEISRRRARQLLTAGGANQRVQDGGAGAHSLFTGQLLRALDEGTADSNGDGYITFTELSGYIQVAASQYNQTPGTDALAGHEQGDFLFVNRAHAGTTEAPAVPAGASPSTADVYKLLYAGKQAFVAKDFVRARESFMQAAELGNAEAMDFLGKLYWEGWGGAGPDRARGVYWFLQAAERGYARSMDSLANIYQSTDPFKDPEEARRWRAAFDEAQRLASNVTLVDPSGQAGRGDPAIPPNATLVPPSPPTGLTIN